MIFWLAVFVGLIVLVVKVLAAPSRQPTDRDALETLNQRFANGDIDIAEFQDSREVCTDSVPRNRRSSGAVRE